jgi:hypothetical protein
MRNDYERFAKKKQTGDFLLPLSLDPESGLERDLELLDFAIDDFPAFLDYFEPVQVADGLGRFGNGGLHGFGKTRLRGSDEFHEFISS